MRGAIVIAAVWAAVLVGAARAVPAADCNGNGQDDLLETESGAAADCNENGAPDECDLTILTLHTGSEIVFDEYYVWTKPIAVDFDGDGALDLAGLQDNIADPSDTQAAKVWLNRGGGAFELQGAFEHAPPHGRALTAGDFDADGRNDIAVVSSVQVRGLLDRLSILLNESQGRFSSPDVYDLPHGVSWEIDAGDFVVLRSGRHAGKEISLPSLIAAHKGAVLHAVFSPDGKRVVTASDDQTARIWDAETGKEIVSLRGHEISVKHVAFSPDGKRVVTASGDRTARIWPVDLLPIAENRKPRDLTPEERDRFEIEPRPQPSER